MLLRILILFLVCVYNIVLFFIYLFVYLFIYFMAIWFGSFVNIYARNHYFLVVAMFLLLIIEFI